ncbi:MAG TPA: deoxyribodipyrimidine photo-lyase [Humisphaera sp.]
MIQPTRVRVISDKPVAAGKYVLYWMQQSQRARFNHALEYAIVRANELKLPLVVGFGLMDDYPEANARHYAFMLQGLRDVEVDLRERGIKFVCRRGQPADVAVGLAKEAALVVCDRGYLRHQKRWRDDVADRAGTRVVEVESDVVVPVDVASDKQEYAARTIRPKIHKRLAEYLVDLPAEPVKHDSVRMRVAGDIDVSDYGAVLATLKLDRSVGPVSSYPGGSREAQRRLEAFVTHKLAGYDEGRNEPAAGHTSTMSAFLHFGQISALDIALRVSRAKHAPQADRDAYLEELIVRRELAANFVHRCPHYDDYECIPGWAQKTLAERQTDVRPALYTLDQLEHAKTADPYWNAAQLEMTKTGFMHNYMRMYWGKKILEWMPTPREAFAATLHLNNKHFLCGRDCISYASVAWVYGLHDRPWGPARKVFGTVRYMNDSGLRRKFDMDAYVKKVALL